LIIGVAVLLLAGLVYSMWRKPKVNLNELTSVNEATSSPPQNTAAASLPQVNFKLMPNATPSHTIELISDANPGQTNGDNGSLAMNFDFALTMNHDGGDQTIATVSETANGSNGSLGMNTGMGLKINFDAGIQTFDSAASLLANQ